MKIREGNRMKKVFSFLFVFLLFFAYGCDAKKTNPDIEDGKSGAVTEKSGDLADTSRIIDTDKKTIGIWEITVKGCVVTDKLSATQMVAQYDGDALEVDIDNMPDPGNMYVLIELIIEKQGSGTDKFLWDHAVVTDTQGNEYKRHPNDTFLSTYNFSRIKSTDLVFGKNDGYVCYELPAGATDGDLFFVYESDNDVVEIQIN